MLNETQIKKIKDAAFEDGQCFRNENPNIDCSEPSSNGGWTDSLLSAATSTELARDFGIELDEDDEWDTDEWDQFLTIYEAEAQRGWEETID